MKFLKPAEHRASVEDIDLPALKLLGKTNLIIDLEGTLVPRENWIIAQGKIDWLKQAKQAGFKMCLLSNTFFSQKAQKIASLLGIPIVTSALKPLPFGFIKAMKLLKGSAKDSVVIGDQLFMDILGGNIAQTRTILVEPLTPEDNIFRKLMRRLEGLVYRPGGRP
jgi:HAD superfamily phosphatase (TIGR01668 family)